MSYLTHDSLNLGKELDKLEKKNQQLFSSHDNSNILNTPTIGDSLCVNMQQKCDKVEKIGLKCEEFVTEVDARISVIKQLHKAYKSETLQVETEVEQLTAQLVSSRENLSSLKKDIVSRTTENANGLKASCLYDMLQVMTKVKWVDSDEDCVKGVVLGETLPRPFQFKKSSNQEDLANKIWAHICGDNQTAHLSDSTNLHK